MFNSRPRFNLGHKLARGNLSPLLDFPFLRGTTLFYTYFVLLWDFPLSSSTCFLFPLIFTSLGDSGWENQTDWFIFKMSLLGILNFVLKSLDVLTLWYALFKYLSFWKFYVPGFMKLVFSSVLCFFCFFFYLQVFLCSGVSSVSLSLSLSLSPS